MESSRNSHYQITTGLLGGLLTTIDNLQPEYKIKYQTNLYKGNINHHHNHHQPSPFVECPLDLTVKSILEPMTPPISPLSSPIKKRYRDECSTSSNDENDNCNLKSDLLTVQKEITPKKHIKTVSTNKKNSKCETEKRDKDKKQHKAIRKLKFDEDKSSPVSGTIIRTLEEINNDEFEHQSGDIDPEYNIVEITDEVKAELATIPNIIGAYICKLCRIEFDDAFGLARHRCSCIVLLEYRCPECGKRFNCPANLASHRRWHKPRDQMTKASSTNTVDTESSYPCNECGKQFKRQAYLRKHQSTHRRDSSDGHSIAPTKSTENSRDSSSYPKLVFKIDTNNTMTSSLSSASSVASDGMGYDSLDSGEPMITKFRMLSGGNFTEDENIAAAALAHLRNGTSVIKHTTALIV